MHTNWQVCSLVVQAKSERISDISTQLNAFPGCEVAVSDAPSGQLIVVVEAEDSETLIQTIESVRNVEGVLAVSLVYHQQFVILSPTLYEKLSQKVAFEIWERKSETEIICRFVTSWATREEELEELDEILQNILS